MGTSLGVPTDIRGGPAPECGCLLVGFGPAGMGVFTGALGIGAFDALLDDGGYAVDVGRTPGAGRLGRYAVRSDSFAESFLAALGGDGSPLSGLRHTDAGRLLTKLRGRPVPMALVARFQVELANAVTAIAAARQRTLVHYGWRVTGARRDGEHWLAELMPSSGPTRYRRQVRTRSLVLATGATQTDRDLAAVEVAGMRPRQVRTHPTLGSDAVVSHGGPQLVRSALSGLGHAPRVVVVGGSHSALASALVVLRVPELVLGEHAITILHNAPMRPMYPTPEAARADGFTDFGLPDICPRTGQVLPLAGFRSESRELLCALRGYGGRPVEPRVVLRHLADQRPDRVRRLLRDADLLILATGYRPTGLPLRDEDGSPIALGGVDGPGPLVDGASHVLDAGGRPVPGIFATGLSSGYPLAGRYGEASFTGAANGLSLWQTDIGAQISQAVIASSPAVPGVA